MPTPGARLCINTGTADRKILFHASRISTGYRREPTSSQQTHGQDNQIPSRQIHLNTADAQNSGWLAGGKFFLLLPHRTGKWPSCGVTKEPTRAKRIRGSILCRGCLANGETACRSQILTMLLQICQWRLCATLPRLQSWWSCLQQ